MKHPDDKVDTKNAANKNVTSQRRWLSGDEIDALLARMDEEAITEEIELERDIAEARRLPWWMFGFSTHVP
jgi:hypothetical protein